MEDLDFEEPISDDEEEGEIEEAAAGLSFDDVVSFTMLMETGVTLIGIFVFFVFIILGVF